MQTAHILEGKERVGSGTGAARALRRGKLIPAIIYGGKDEPLKIALDEKQLLKETSVSGFFGRVITLKIDNKEHAVLAKDVQLHPVTDLPLHVDFQRIDKNSRVHVQVPIHFINEEKSPGVKRGGTLNIIAHNLEIVCSPSEIPEGITIDLITLDMNGSVTLDSIKLPAGVKAANAVRDHVIATLVGGSKDADESKE
jgi:large subunit ribosomal protein L25